MAIDKLEVTVPDKPTYEQLVQMYFDAKSAVISEYNTGVESETLRLWRRCSEWSDQLVDTTSNVRIYAQWEAAKLATSAKNCG